jgi:predicted PurR-regulated permease PerM
MHKNPNQPDRATPPGPHLWEIVWVRDLLWTGAVIFLLAVAWHLRPILLPVFLGLLLAYLFYPSIRSAKDRLRIPKPVTVLFILAIMISLGAAAAVWLIPPLIEQGSTLVRNLPQYLETLRDQYGVPLGEIPRDPAGLLEKLNLRSRSVIPVIQGVIGTSVMVLLWIVLAPVSFFVFSLKFDRLVGYVRSCLPLKHRVPILRTLGRMDEAVGNFFRGRLLISIVISLFFSAGWFFAEVPYWFLLGVATGLLSIIPYLSTIGWFAAILVKYLEMTSGAQPSGLDFLAVFVWPTVVYQAVNVIEEYILTPWVQGRATTLNPLTILVVVFIGGWAAGFLGLIFAIPAASCLKILWEDVSPILFKPEIERPPP